MRTLSVALLVVSLAASAHAQEQGSSGDKPLPASVQRILDGLQRPPLDLTLPPVPAATFHVEVEAPWRVETPLESLRRELAADVGATRRPGPATGGTPALAQVDVLPAIYAAVHRIQAIRREHAEAAARREVAEDLAQFCATHDCSASEPPAIEGVIAP